MNTNVFKYEPIKSEQGFWEVKNLPNGNYDGMAGVYEKMLSSTLYNKIMWGNTPNDYSRFVEKNISESQNAANTLIEQHN